MRAKLRIIGVGNLLLGDEGVGIHVIHALEKHPLPPGIELVDAGVAGVGLLPLFEDAEQILLVDAAEMNQPPGTPRFFEWSRGFGAESPELSLHETRLPAILRLGQEIGELPKITILGIQPQRIEWNMELSPPLIARLPEVIEEIKTFIGQCLRP